MKEKNYLHKLEQGNLKKSVYIQRQPCGFTHVADFFTKKSLTEILNNSF